MLLCLCEDFLDDFGGFYAAEFEVESLEFVGEGGVVDAELVQQCGVKIVDCDFVLHDTVAEFVGLAVNDAALDAAACHEEGKGIDVVIPTCSLAHGSASEFAAPDDEGVFEHSALQQILNQGCGGLIGIPC